MGRQEFFQEEIYKLNREVRQFAWRWKSAISIIPSAFNTINRCVNYFPVRGDEACDRWSFVDENEKIRHFLDKRSDFDEFLGIFDEAVRGQPDDLHYFLINLYNKFPVNPNLFLDGIIKRSLPEFIGNKHPIKYAFVDLLNREKGMFDYNHFPWVNVRLFYDEDPDKNPFMGIVADQESDRSEKYGEWFGIKHKGLNEIMGSGRMEKAQNLQLEGFFFEYLQPLFMGYEKDNRIFDGSGFFPLESQEVSRFEHLLLIPFYDAWIDEEPCGALKGNLLIIPFEGDSDYAKRKEFIIEHLERFTTWSRCLSQLLFESRSHVMLKVPIQTGDDFLKDFLRKIAFVQDWERIAVFNESNARQDLKFCFKRFRGGKEGQGRDYERMWDICEAGENCGDCTPQCPKDVLNINKSRAYFFVELKTIMNPKMLPSIDSPDIPRYSNHVLCFEFPKDTYIPEGHDNREEGIKRLGEHYLNKLIPIFDRLLLKRKVLERSVKSAVAAIISRNHSHHIGSHVTPRASVKRIEERLGTLDCNVPDKQRLEVIDLLKSQLDEYIQKKADFMAEISTEPLAATKSISFFNELILYFIRNSLFMDNIGANEGINYKKGKCNENRLRIHVYLEERELMARFGSSPSCSCDLTHLNFPYSGSCYCLEPAPLHVIDPELKDVTVALPGPLGEFAFYSFMENFIRNAAKHNHEAFLKNPDFYLDVHIKISELPENDRDRNEFYKMEIWENATKPDRDLKDLLTLLIEEPVVDDYGQLRKGGWGIAEMKIMATLLRGSDDFTTMGSNLSLTGDEKLTYELRMMKPKEVAVISKDCKADDDQNKRGVWWFSSLTQFLDYQRHGTSPASFNLVIMDQGVIDGQENYPHFLPYRTLAHNELKGGFYGAVEIDDAFMKSIRQSNAENVISAAWGEWVRGLLERSYPGADTRLAIFFSQEERMAPTKEWLSKADQWEKGDHSPKLSVIHQGEDDNEIRPAVCGDERMLVFDRHFDGYECLPGDKEIGFHEAFDKKSSDFVPIFSSAPTDAMIFRLAESACLKVLIMDERIAEVAYEEMMKDEGNKPYALYDSKQRLEVSRWANMFIATHMRINSRGTRPLHRDIEGNTPRVLVELAIGAAGEKRINDFSVYWCGEESRKEIKPDALIIHQGVLENFVGEAIHRWEGEDFVDALKAFLDDLKEFIPYVAVDSGRGVPANLPPEIKFIPFSLIEDYVMKDRISKYCLTQLLMGLIRRSNG